MEKGSGRRATGCSRGMRIYNRCGYNPRNRIPGIHSQARDGMVSLFISKNLESLRGVLTAVFRIFSLSFLVLGFNIVGAGYFHSHWKSLRVPVDFPGKGEWSSWPGPWPAVSPYGGRPGNLVERRRFRRQCVWVLRLYWCAVISGGNCNDGQARRVALLRRSWRNHDSRP